MKSLVNDAAVPEIEYCQTGNRARAAMCSRPAQSAQSARTARWVAPAALLSAPPYSIQHFGRLIYGGRPVWPGGGGGGGGGRPQMSEGLSLGVRAGRPPRWCSHGVPPCWPRHGSAVNSRYRGWPGAPSSLTGHIGETLSFRSANGVFGFWKILCSHDIASVAIICKVLFLVFHILTR